MEHFDQRRIIMEETITKPRTPWLAAAISFLATGLGQLYNGQWQKALLFFAAELLAGVGILLNMGTFQSMLLGISALLIINIAFAAEAYIAARKLYDYTLKPVNKMWVYVVFLVVTAAISGSLDSFLKDKSYETFKIPSSSMLDTLRPGDHLMAERLAVSEPIERGDIVIFTTPDSDKNFIKRVVALPGETIEIADKTVFINGRELEEPYAQFTMDDYQADRDTLPARQLEDDQFFLMGDNRDESYDSRFVGAIERKAIIGRALYIYFPGGKEERGWFSRFGIPVQ